MIALDTNVLARYLLADEPRHARAARMLLERTDEQFWVPLTVVLELAWVLRKTGVPRAVVTEQLRYLFSLPGVHAQMPEAIGEGLRWADAGLDIADALHLALSAKADRFATFDRALVQIARKLGATPTVTAF